MQAQGCTSAHRQLRVLEEADSASGVEYGLLIGSGLGLVKLCTGRPADLPTHTSLLLVGGGILIKSLRYFGSGICSLYSGSLVVHAVVFSYGMRHVYRDTWEIVLLRARL